MPKINNRSERQVANMKEVIRRVLRKSGVDTGPLGTAIEMLASDILAFRRVRAVVLDEETDLFPVEYSREDHPRATVHPAIDAMAKLSDRVNRDIKNLALNAQKRQGDAVAGSFADILGKIEREEDEEIDD